MNKAWAVTMTVTIDYNSIDHGDFITSAEDARQDAKDWLMEHGADPHEFEITVEEREARDALGRHT